MLFICNNCNRIHILFSENVSDQASDENKSESGDISNQDSSRFISKESFPDSIFSGNESSERYSVMSVYYH